VLRAVCAANGYFEGGPIVTGLAYGALPELREQFPRKLIAEMVSWIARFEENFESATSIGKGIGRSSRTIFRYFRELKDRGLLTRIPGSRLPEYLPKHAKRPWALTAHGYSFTKFLGQLAPFVAHNSAKRVNAIKAKKAAARKAKQDAQAERDRYRRQAHEEFLDANPHLREPPKRGRPVETTERKPVEGNRPIPRPSQPAETVRQVPESPDPD
jgi:hypothetical protein